MYICIYIYIYVYTYMYIYAQIERERERKKKHISKHSFEYVHEAKPYILGLQVFFLAAPSDDYDCGY